MSTSAGSTPEGTLSAAASSSVPRPDFLETALSMVSANQKATCCHTTLREAPSAANDTKKCAMSPSASSPRNWRNVCANTLSCGTCWQAVAETIWAPGAQPR